MCEKPSPFRKKINTFVARSTLWWSDHLQIARNCFRNFLFFQSTTARSKVQYILKARVNIHARWLEIILMAPPKSANVKALSANESPIIAQNTCFVNKTRNAQKWKHYDGHMSNVAVTRRKQYRLAARRRSPDLRGVFLVLIVWQPAFSPHNSPLIHGCTHNQAADEIFTRAPSEENFFCYEWLYR